MNFKFPANILRDQVELAFHLTTNKFTPSLIGAVKIFRDKVCKNGFDKAQHY